MNQEKKIRVFEMKFTDVDSDSKVGYIKGYASTFGNVDQGLDVCDQGCFAKTIKDNGGKFPVLIDHNPYTPWGWNTQAAEDSRGLKVEAEVQLQTEEQRNRYQLAKRAQEMGIKVGLSIGYSTIKAEPDPDNLNIRHLKELKLWEYSQVTFPMNTEAALTGVKSQAAFLTLFDRLQKAGHDEEVLIQALLKLLGTPGAKAAATPEVDPELLQSMDRAMKSLRG